MQKSNVIDAFRTPLNHQTAEDQGFRAFTVEDPSGVEIPGCLSIDELRLDGHTIPQFVRHEVPTDSTHTRFKDLDVRMYTLQQGPKGIPVLLRSLQSNDGRWQVRSVIHIKGQFEDEKPPEQKAATPKAAGADSAAATDPNTKVAPKA